MSRVHNWWITLRAANLPTVWSNVLLGVGLSVQGFESNLIPVLSGTLIGVSLLYLAGMAINDAGDVAFDRANNSTRPVAAGRISVTLVAAVGWLLLVIGFSVLAATAMAGNPRYISAVVAAGVLTLLIILYHFLHRRSALAALLLMAGCRACVPVLAALLLVGRVDAVVWIAAAAVSLWTIGITTIGRGERGGESRLNGGIVWMILACIGIAGVGVTSPLGTPLATGAGLLVVLVVWLPCLYLRIKAGRHSQAVCWAIAGLAILDAALLVSGGRTQWAWAALAMAVVTRITQRLGRGS